jgi:hypothetical protein
MRLKTLAGATAAAAGSAFLYRKFLRQPILTWGAAADEAAARLPGDELLENADGVATRAITIDAPRSAVWPWLAQMGPAPRGGAYTPLRQHKHAEQGLPCRTRAQQSASPSATSSSRSSFRDRGRSCSLAGSSSASTAPPRRPPGQRSRSSRSASPSTSGASGSSRRSDEALPAPGTRPRRFVAVGPYRWVRNPIYVAALAVVLGEAWLFLSPALLAYAGAMAIVCHAFVVAYEEPTLRRRFGVVYDDYLATVDRWIPHLPGRN